MRLCALLLVLIPTYAFAQPRPTSDPQKMHNDDCARARKLGKPCVLNIEAEEIEKGVVKPDGTDIGVRDPSKFPSLVRIRTEFIAEIIKSANDID